jgi:nicotinate-nucleotide pyrophosphorylase (carboxylating)
MKTNQSFIRQPWLDPEVKDFVRRALREDIGWGDLTSQALINKDRRISARITAHREYVVAGVEIVKLVCRLADRGIVCRVLVPDGKKVKAGASIMVLTGRARSILAAERTALNFLQRLMGIASLTAEYCARAGKVKILDTRKTTPNMRTLEKYAVRCGGGKNHRFGLYDMILIKDNHRFLWGKQKTLAQAVTAVRRLNRDVPVEIEVESLAQFKDALSASPDWIMLDNMQPDLMKKCVNICAGRCKLEASGGVNMKNIGKIAATGVDAVSIGALTHSAPAADLSLEVKHSATRSSLRNPPKPWRRRVSD